jgi:SAM-dependent methyltransferase
MTLPPRLFDTDLLALRRARAARSGTPADFLHEAVADELLERVSEVNRSFQFPAVIGSRPHLWTAAITSRGLPAPLCVPDSDVLPLEPESHDLLIHALALHWANDPVAQLIQSRRALKPDGLLLVAMFGGQTLHELRAALAEAEIGATGGLSPRIAPMGEIRDLGALLQRAGFALPVADALKLSASYESAFHLMRDLRAMGETNVLADRLRHPTRRSIFVRAADVYAERFPHGPGGRVRATFEVIVLTGWTPHETQQKPLRPGSAARRLADALGAEEQPTGIKARR